MDNTFSGILADLRQQAGFPTAYRFFHDNGGKHVLKASYRQYLLWEQGKALPPVAALGRLLPALKLLPGSAQHGALAAGWLASLAGGELYKEVFAPFLAVKDAAVSPLHKAMSRALNEKKYPLSVDQAVAILSDPDHYKAFLFMINDRGDWSEARLADEAGLGKGAAARVAKDFLKAGLLKKAGARLKCVLVDSMVEFPRAEIMPAGYGDRMEKFQDGLLASGGRAWRRLGFLRADARDFAAFFPLMSLNMSTAATYAVTEKGPATAMFAVEGRVVKLKDF